MKKKSTETKNKEEVTIKLEEEKAKKYLDVIASIIVALDVKGDVILLNKKGYEIIGYKEGELIGKNWFETCLPEKDREEVREVFRKCMTGKIKLVEHYENPVLTKKGKERIISWYNTLLKDKKGKLIGLLSSGEDITERKDVEKELRKTVERLQLVARATNDAIWDWDLLTDRVWWNEGVRTLFGYSAGDVRPDVTWWKENIHPEDRNRVVKGIYAVIKEGGNSWSDEYRFVRKDYSYAFIFDRGFIIHDNGKKAVRMIGSMMDITKHKEAEKKLQEAHQELEEKVRERTAKLTEANNELRKSEQELKKKINELERMNKIMMDRETKMMEMKKRIEILEKETNK